MLGSRIIPLALAAVVAVGSAGAALAGSKEKGGNEAAAALGAKTSLTQAIAAAEQQTGGRAFDSGLENEDGKMTYEVEVAKDNTVQKVLVDADSGKVIKVMADEADEDQDGEHEEE